MSANGVAPRGSGEEVTLRDDDEAPKCKPPACIDAYVLITDVTAQNIGQESVGPNGTTVVWLDHQLSIQDEIKDRLKKKYHVDGKRRHVLEECGETCSCVKTWEKEKDAQGNGEKKTYKGTKVEVYVDKDGKFVAKDAKDAVCKLTFEVTVQIDIYGHSGICSYDRSGPI